MDLTPRASGTLRSIFSTMFSISTNARSARKEHRKLGSALAHASSWIVLGVLNACVIAITLPSATWNSFSERAAHQYYDFGHMLMLAVVSFGAAELWTRFGSKRWWVTTLVQAAVTFAVAWLLMKDDLDGLVRRQAAESSATVWYTLDCLALGAATAAVAAFARLLARPYLCWLTVAGALCVGVANHLILRYDYPGVHFFAAWAAALALGGSLSTIPIPFPVTRRVREGSLVAAVAITVASVPSLIVRPSGRVWQDLFRSPGSVVAPLLARIKTAEEIVPLPIEGSPWFQSRQDMPSIPPSQPRFAPANAIALLITVDALRYDVSQGKHADQLPNLEAIRQESVEFSKARSPSSATVTSTQAIFSGRYYSGLYWTPFPEAGKYKGVILPYQDTSVRLPGLLSKGGVRSVHVAALHGFQRKLGLSRGFDEVILTRKDWGPAKELMDKAMARLERQNNSPLFMYMHFADPHAPYTLAGTEGTEHERYIREISLVDTQLGRLRTFLAKHNLEHRVILILSADHGEAFGEHGTKYHAVTLYEELVRVPLFVKAPGLKRRVIDEPVTLVDLAPTILDAYGLPTPGIFLGQSLVPLLRGQDVHLTRPIAAEGGRRIEALYFDDGRKAIVDLKKNTREVYDLSKDPGETQNLVGIERSRAEYYLGVERAFFNAHRYPKPGYEPPWRKF